MITVLDGVVLRRSSYGDNFLWIDVFRYNLENKSERRTMILQHNTNLRLFIIAITALSILLPFAAKAQKTDPNEADRSAILQGVQNISAPGLPGTVCAFGDQAFPLVLGKSGNKLHSPVAAATRYGRGRAIILGHSGYLESEGPAQADNEKFLLNSLQWLAGDSKLPIGIRRMPALKALLTKKGIPNLSMDSKSWVAEATMRCSVICCPPDDLSYEDAAILRTAIKGGKSYLGADTGWGWLQIHPGKSLADHPGNRMLHDAGLYWTDGTLDKTSSLGFKTDFPLDPAFYQANRSAALLLGRLLLLSWMTPEKDRQAVETVISASRNLPENDTLFRSALNKTLLYHTPDTLKAFLQKDKSYDPMARLVTSIEAQAERNSPIDKIKASPAAKNFPGEVKTAVRVVETIKVDATVPDWHSTGLYAAPGETIKVELPKEAVGKGLGVRIGAHTDTLWHLEKWDRSPEISRLFALSTLITKAANPFGGLIYITVPENCKLGMINVKIINGVKAPYFKLGKTTEESWNLTVRAYPAPWAELEGDRVILTVPSDAIRDLSKPVSLMTLWDKTMDDVADLAGIPRQRARQERYVTDKQISAGYMHAGYPIMTFLDVAKPMVNEEIIRKVGHGGVWGFWHEVGHNHQQPDWTFEGTGEVTNNLFALYVFEKEFGITESQHPALKPEVMKARMQKYFDGGSNFEEWKSDPFLALSMYIQLQKAFGWEPFEKTFTAYRYLRASERPVTELQKHDQWMVRFSRAANRNLAPFFQKWGMPTSESARKSIMNLPEWKG